jgi:Omp85 superfamily domain
MSTLGLLISLLILPLLPQQAQETDPPDGTRINSAQVSGIELSRLSPGLQEEIGKLAGTPLNRQAVREIAARIEAEQPRFIAAVRVTPDPEAGARVVFVVARMRDQEHGANINTRHLVEDVEIRGVPEHDLDPTLRADLQALTGKPLDPEEVERLETRLKGALSDYELSWRTVKGSQPGRIRLIFDAHRAESARWLRFEPLEANAIFHSDQGWGAILPITMNSRDVHVTPIIAIDNGDDLIEEYSGFGLRFETRKLGTERLGAFFEWNTFDQTWRDATLATLALDPGLARPYRNRMTFTPLVKFAITRQLSIGGGVSITELDPLSEAGFSDSQMANAAIGSLRFSERSKRRADQRHDVDAAFTVRAGTNALESDLVYERYLGQADYSYRWSNHRVLLSGMAGRIDGHAPLYERFSLGDSRTLRGWDKYDIAPAGGDRVLYGSVEYRYRGLAMFLDAGSVWNRDTDRRARFSAGLGFNPGPVFFTVGFPLNTDEFRAVFTMGLRFSSSAVGFQKN